MSTNHNIYYKRGAYKEQKIVRDAKAEGKIALRSTASQSPIDVVIIDNKKHTIELIQCKSTIKLRGGIEPKLKEKLEKEWDFLSGIYNVYFKAM